MQFSHELVKNLLIVLFWSIDFSNIQNTACKIFTTFLLTNFIDHLMNFWQLSVAKYPSLKKIVKFWFL